MNNLELLEKVEQEAEEAKVVGSKDSLILLNAAKAITIKTPQENVKASIFLKTVKGQYKLWDTKRKELVAPINEAKTRLQAEFNPILDKFKAAEMIIKTELLRYSRDTEAARIKKQEAIQLKYEKMEEDRKKKIYEQADKAKEKGNLEKAERLTEKAETHHEPVPIIPKQETPKGLSIRTVYKAQVVNFSQLPDEYKISNDKMLNDLAKAKQGKNPPPGVDFYSEQSPSQRYT